MAEPPVSARIPPRKAQRVRGGEMASGLDERRCAISDLPGDRPGCLPLSVGRARVLTVGLMAITSTNMPVTGSARYSRQERPGNGENSAQGAGIRVWLTAEAPRLRQTRMLWWGRMRFPTLSP